MGDFVPGPVLAVLLPLVLAALIALGGSRAVWATKWLAMLGPLVLLGVGLMGASQLPGLGGSVVSPYTTATVAARVTWLQIGDRTLGLGFAVDGLSALMLVIVGAVAFCVMLFSVGYMAEERGLARYYSVLSLFTAAMAGLVIADGFGALFVAWELVGACSFLLIGFWYQKPSAAAAAIKAFIVTRVGDVGLLMAIALLWARTGSLAYADVMAELPALAPVFVTVVALLVFVGAAGKSAQFPLHVWLPDAMEGPTPVSALIHAATMVAAGVFLIARTWPIFEASMSARSVVLAIGTLTALGAATVAVTQRDIKKVLAYSTISQLGFMFAALGAGAWAAAMFHLTTHAAFKALLFLSAGSLIHGSGTQDLREMGGLAKKMPLTATTWVVGSLALAGIPPLSGFFSKDLVLHSVWVASPLAGAALLIASALTAFYVARAGRLALAGRYRGDGHPHESGWVMTVPLAALAVPAALAGAAAALVQRLAGEAPEALSPAIAGASAAVALVFVALGWTAYRGGVEADELIGSRLGALWRAASAAYGADAAVRALVVRPFERLSSAMYSSIERRGIDGAVEGTGRLAVRAGVALSSLQNGESSWYVQLTGVGFLAIFALAVSWQRLIGWLGR